MPDLDSLSAATQGWTAASASGSGGTATGGAGGAGSGAAGGSSAGGGVNGGNVGTADGSNTAAGGSGGSNGGSGGSNGGSGGEATSGEAGAGGAGCDEQGLVACPGEVGCSDLSIGDADGASVANCGECGVSCGLANASRAACEDGHCTPVCHTGFDDCNAQAINDGCETAITTVNHCGACNYACASRGATEVACSAARCAPSCMPHFANCNATDALTNDDGCETYLETLTACRASCAAAPVDCDASQVCTAGACVAPQGVVALSIPLTEANQEQRYSNLFGPGLDLATTQFVVRVYAPGASAGTLLIYFSAANFAAGGGGNYSLASFADGWRDVVFAVGPPSGDYDPATVTQLNFHIDGGAAGPWEPSPVLIYIDAIRSRNGIVNETFDTGLGNMHPSSLLVVSGSTLSWVDSIPDEAGE